MIELSYEIDARGPGSWINDQIISNVLTLRSGLKNLTGSPELDNYHCTLVSLLIGKNVSIAVHIGDGAIFAGKSTPLSESCLSINEKVYSSLPENGEYRNETYFITEPHWLKHLRIKVFGEIDWFVMGSDGGMDVLCDRDRLSGSLVAELIKDIAANSRANSTVKELITSEFAVRKTSDDITCAIGFAKDSIREMDLIWDDRLVSEVHLYPSDTLQPQPLPIAPVVMAGSSVERRSNSKSNRSNSSFPKISQFVFLMATFSFFLGGGVSFLFYEPAMSMLRETEKQILNAGSELEEDALKYTQHQFYLGRMLRR
jgi:serine/threonine protein phosphatase PrpC